MPDIVLSDEMLKNALSLYQEQTLSDIMYNDSDFSTSQSFENKMQKLLKSESNLFYKMTLTSTRKAVCVVVAVFILLLSSLSVGAVRKAIANFFTDIFDGYNIVTADTSSVTDYPQTIQKSYVIGKVPSGYKLTDTEITDKTTFYQYENGTKTLIFEQFTMERFFLYVDNINSKFTKETYNGQEYYIQNYQDKSTSIMWNNGEYVFVMISSLPKSDMLKISTTLKCE